MLRTSVVFPGVAAFLFTTPIAMDAAVPAASKPAAARTAIIGSLPTTPAARHAAAKDIITQHEPMLHHADPLVRLNTAILFAELHTLSSDAVLIQMLTHADPAVRFWGAKGLRTLAPILQTAGPARAKNALIAAEKAESSPEVKAEITATLAAF